MREFNKVLGLAALALVLVLPARANAEESYGERFMAKLQSGVSNVVLGWTEIGKNAINISSQQGFLCGITYGIGRGAVHGAVRTVVGALDVLTSPFGAEDYVTPAYVWDRPSEDSRYFGLHLPGEWTEFGPLDDGGMGR